MKTKVRCRWAVEHPELIDYHDHVWSIPTRDDRRIFAAYGQCILHAGLHWTGMLKKRAAFAAAFDGWDYAQIARYGDEDIARLMLDGPLRNLQKINAIINNAQRFIEVQQECGSFANYIWRFTEDEPILCDHKSNPATQAQQALADDLKRLGFKFSGPGTALGLMQDIGMVNEHDDGCFLRAAPSH